MVVSSSGGRDVRGKMIGGGDLSLLFPEHSLAVHCNQSHYVPVSGGGTDSWVKGVQAVGRSGWIGMRGDVEGDSGGRMDRGG